MDETPTYAERKFVCRNSQCSKVMVLTPAEYAQKTYACPYCQANGSTTKALAAPLSYADRKFMCPKPQCSKVMIRTTEEIAQKIYSCPYCRSNGTVTASRAFRDEDGREYRYERGSRVYLDGCTPPVEKPIQRPDYAKESQRPAGTSDEWTVCRACGATLKSKNFQRHQEKNCRPSKPSRQPTFPRTTSQTTSSRHYTPSYSSSYYKPGPATCARCGRYVEWPVYYNGDPYGSYCVQRVRGW